MNLIHRIIFLISIFASMELTAQLSQSQSVPVKIKIVESIQFEFVNNNASVLPIKNANKSVPNGMRNILMAYSNRNDLKELKQKGGEKKNYLEVFNNEQRLIQQVNMNSMISIEKLKRDEIIKLLIPDQPNNQQYNDPTITIIY